VPPSLRSTFERNQIDYLVHNQRGGANSRWATKADDSTATGRKAKFGDQYLTRLGRSGFKTAGTDFSTEKTEDWEEVRLKRQLADLDEKLQKVEEVAERRKGGKRDSKPALVKKELDQLLDYKRRQLRELEEGSSKGASGGSSLKSIQEDLETVREQVDGLVSHLRTREQALEQIRQEIEDERAGR
jgi:actin cytoskeleton-regulatory complex protein END3